MTSRYGSRSTKVPSTLRQRSGSRVCPLDCEYPGDGFGRSRREAAVPGARSRPRCGGTMPDTRRPSIQSWQQEHRRGRPLAYGLEAAPLHLSALHHSELAWSAYTSSCPLTEETLTHTQIPDFNALHAVRLHALRSELCGAHLRAVPEAASAAPPALPFHELRRRGDACTVSPIVARPEAALGDCSRLPFLLITTSLDISPCTCGTLRGMASHDPAARVLSVGYPSRLYLHIRLVVLIYNSLYTDTYA